MDVISIFHFTVVEYIKTYSHDILQVTLIDFPAIKNYFILDIDYRITAPAPCWGWGPVDSIINLYLN